MNIFIKIIRTQLIKYLMTFLSFMFSLNVIGESVDIVGNLFKCNSNDTSEKYDILKQEIEKNFSADLIFSLGKTAACIGKKQESTIYLQKAADLGNIPAISTVGLSYYKKYWKNRTSDDRANNLNFYKGLLYIERAVQMIEALPEHPKSSTNETSLIEPTPYISHHMLIGLPIFHFEGYISTLMDIINNKEMILYNNTLDILNKMQQTAAKCLGQPALDAWKERKEIIFQAQQAQCNAILSVTAELHHLEQQRIKIGKTCTVPLGSCDEHLELFNEIMKLVYGTMQTVIYIEYQVLPPLRFGSKV